jgi:phosphoribosylaminoimidazole (AIR) synthetase
MSEIGSTPTTTPPTGTTWVGDWDADFCDRVYGSDPVVIGDIAALVTGVQHRSGATVSGVALRVDGTVIGSGRTAAVTSDLTPGQARDLAGLLVTLADRAEAIDGIGSSRRGSV